MGWVPRVGLCGGMTDLIGLRGTVDNHGTARGFGGFVGIRRRFTVEFAGYPFGVLVESRFLNQHAGGYVGECWLNADAGNMGWTSSTRKTGAGVTPRGRRNRPGGSRVRARR